MRRPVAVRVVGPMQWIVVPALIAVAVTIVLATPVKLFGLTLPEPITPMVLAFAWPLIRPSMFAPLVLLVVGLAIGTFLDWPMGLMPLGLLTVYAVVLVARSFLMGQETQVLFVWYAACVVLSFLLMYVIVAIGAKNPPSILGSIGQIVPTLLLFPFANGMIERFDDGDVRFR